MRYRHFYQIDGRHPWRDAAPDAYVDYAARTRHGGRVFYFNFELAKEMGLIGKRHSHRLNAALNKAILDNFSLVIINEYDIEQGIAYPAREIRSHKYMATRYLQCQHPSRQGLTSGDGRSMWNGYFAHRGKVWDISSCGTGATCLSPATAIYNKFFKTGDDTETYACGMADLTDGLCAALMSDIFHKNGIVTERTLAIIAFADGTAIVVRTYQNLLRPAHLFRLLKQGRLHDLRSAVDYYTARQITNGAWPRPRGKRGKYELFLRKITESFASAAAKFESEYVFCWLDWDGDNVLMDGAVLDYGSVRQFGLYHHEYRYDDVERMSTTITEQKNKAKYIVQTFVQMVDYMISGSKKGIRHFAGHPVLKTFDRVFEDTKDALFLYKLGYPSALGRKILQRPVLRRALRRMRAIMQSFERVQSRKGVYQIEDGITADALFCIRDIFREMPAHCLVDDDDMDARRFIEIMQSEYVTAQDTLLTPARRAWIKEFQALYRRLIEGAVTESGQGRRSILRAMQTRSALINRYERVTGDAVINVGERLVKGAAHMSSQALHNMFAQFVEQQVLRPEYFAGRHAKRQALKNRKARHLLNAMLRDVRDLRAGL